MKDELRKLAKKNKLKDISDKMKDMMRVTVASKTPEGLKAGLEKAEDMIEGGGLPDKEDILEMLRKRKKKEEY